MANINNFFDWFDKAFADLETFKKDGEKAYADICKTTNGWASPGKLHTLHNALLHMEGDEQYLEIGTYTGRSIAGALINNDKLAQVIDPFELFLPDGKQIYEGWLRTVNRYDVLDRITLHKTLCDNFDGELPPIGVCYFDGDHDSGHTYEALKKFEPYLSDQAIVICDDYSMVGGHQQKPYPGHNYVLDLPVKADVDRWLLETPNAELVAMLPWENQSAIIRYERN